SAPVARGQPCIGLINFCISKRGRCSGGNRRPDVSLMIRRRLPYRTARLRRARSRAGHNRLLNRRPEVAAQRCPVLAENALDLRCGFGRVMNLTVLLVHKEGASSLLGLGAAYWDNLVAVRKRGQLVAFSDDTVRNGARIDAQLTKRLVQRLM